MDEPYRGPNLGPLSGAPDGGWDAFPEATKAQSWDAFPEAKPSKGVKDTAIDVAKSAGIGVARGVIGLGGLVGDVTDLGAKGLEKASDFISDKVGIDRYKRPEGGSALDNIPTSQSITKAVEGVTGDFYKPETTAGEYARTVGEFLPASIAGPGGIIRKVGMQAVLPGVASEAAGQATEGTPIEPYARAAAGIAAGVGGSLIGRPSSTTSAIRAQMPEGLTQATVDDARSLMLNAKQKGIDLTWPEALSQVSGRPVLSDTQRILESAPGSRTRMQEFYSQRPQQIDQAALNEFRQVAPGTQTPSQIGPKVAAAADETLGDVRKTINRAAEPYYTAAETVTLSPAEMAQVRRIPGYQDARDAVRNNPQINWRVAHLPDESVGFLNEVKQHFDQAAKNAKSKFNPAANKRVQSSNEMAASAIKQIGETVSPEYQVALGVQAQAREKYLQPLLDGPLGRLAKKDITTQKAIDALFPSNPLPNSHHEISIAVGALAKKNPAAAQQLVRAHVESVFNEATRSLQSGANQFGGAGYAKALVGNIQQRANLQAAIEALPNGQKLWQGFDNFLEAAEATGTRQPKGSLTSFNDAELKAMSGSNMLGEAVKTAASPGKWWSIVNDKWSQWKLGSNLDELARIFTDPNSAPVLKRIAAMPKGSREAQYLVSRLILQAENAAVQPREARRQ
jgi:hypothetical protein